jgi:phosphoribosylglycinamide formyltransferase 1
MKKQRSGGKIRVAMLASGSGTNVENFIKFFKSHAFIEISLVISNRADAFVLERAVRNGIDREVIAREMWKNGQVPVEVLNKHHIDFIVLAGFLLLVPESIIKEFPDRIVNIHPALLPDFGGKGMYGMRVHEAVIDSGVGESGISIHLVNGRYDEGQVLFQARVAVLPGDTPQTLAQKVHQLEYAHYPRVVEDYIRRLYEK